jgi:hypothetical protein
VILGQGFKVLAHGFRIDVPRLFKGFALGEGGNGVGRGAGVHAPVNVKGYAADAILVHDEKKFDGITALPGLFSVPIGVFKALDPFIPKGHFEIPVGMILPEIHGA